MPEHGVRTDEAVWRQHRSKVEAFFADTGIAHEFAGVVGQPADEIVEVAEQRNADLIVVGTREPGFLERLLEGSVSEGVARRAHRDVLIVHPASVRPGAADRMTDPSFSARSRQPAHRREFSAIAVVEEPPPRPDPLPEPRADADAAKGRILGSNVASCRTATLDAISDASAPASLAQWAQQNMLPPTSTP